MFPYHFDLDPLPTFQTSYVTALQPHQRQHHPFPYSKSPAAPSKFKTKTMPANKSRLLDYSYGSQEYEDMDDYSDSGTDDRFYPSNNEPGKRKRKSAAGRELIRWDPGRDQLCLLCLDHVCTTQGIAIPWDSIAQLMGGLLGKPTMTGEAIKQHMAKLHKARQEGHQPVPPKLDRNQRRRAATVAAANTDNEQLMPPPPCARPANSKNKRQEKAAAPTTPTKPGQGLLFEKAKPTKSKKPKLGLQTPVSANGRHQIVKDEFDSDDCFAVDPNIPAPSASGNKRSRKSKGIGYRDDAVVDDTPAKKPRSRRITEPKNYAEAPALIEDYEFDPNAVNNQPLSSQSSAVFDQALPQFGSVQASPEHPVYEIQSGMPPLPYHFAPQNNGIPLASMPDSTILGAHSHTPRYVNNGYNSQYEQNLQILLNSSNQHALKQSSVGQNNLARGFGDVQATDFANGHQQSGHNSQSISPNHSVQVTRTNSQDFGDLFGNATGLADSPIQTIGQAETGITPNMAQHGFDEFGLNGNGTHANIQHNESFDSGYGGFPADAAGVNKLEFGIDDFVNFEE